MSVPVPSERAVTVAKTLFGVLVVGVMAWFVFIALAQDGTIRKAVTTSESASAAAASLASVNATQDAVLDRQEEALRRANQRLRVNDLPTVPVPTTTTSPQPGSPGATGLRGPGPTRAQVAAAVAAECADGCATPQQISAGVIRYCSTHVCGPTGEPGPIGPSGPVGSQGPKGDTGPGASSDEIQAQVAVYCAANPCGTQGPKGETGPPGSAVPGTYDCNPGEFATGFTIATDGTITLRCAPALALPQGPTETP